MEAQASYNIKGLPWPLAGREAATSAIGRRLAAMRSDKAQPHVVLLQEAFADSTPTLNKAADYPYVVIGPQVSRPDARHPLGPAFAADAQWVKGERSGSLIDSGLAVLSDYPVIKIERYAFQPNRAFPFTWPKADRKNQSRILESDRVILESVAEY